MYKLYPEDRLLKLLREDAPFKVSGARLLRSRKKTWPRHYRLSIYIFISLALAYSSGLAVVVGWNKTQGSSAAMSGFSGVSGTIERMKLQGIISGEKPQAIFEDRFTHDTYNLFQGDTFNGMKILKIHEGKVIVNIRGQKIEFIL
jgi:hypothetical protein